ncbi:MAG: hypothetical protein D6690_01065 [Nitrospirae bacterium]|nr:MAG: hypothetical protein D6690_01065 [Nitrospirota bacterium]
MATRMNTTRERLDRDETESLRRNGNLFIDDRRRRPLYFDGRFLTARDLNREQQYFLTRQSDLNRAYGSGVVTGLMVGQAEHRSLLTIEPGHGLTPAGEPVVIAQPVNLRLSDIPEMQRLDASFGLLPIPHESPRSRSGLFIIALRPVEFSANPITSYPTSVTGTRTVEDGDIVEATAISLIPYPDDAARNEIAGRRSAVAREIFLGDGVKGIPAGVLPLAMIALDRGTLQWVDNFMVRRELSADPREMLRLGLAPRASRLAYIHQYHQQLNEILEQRQQLGLPANFPATDHFLALPPCGRFPAAAINPLDFTQMYFPGDMDIELSIVPEDEVSVLIEHALDLPPIDLTMPAEELESTSLLVLAPVPRQAFRAHRQALSTLSLPIKHAAPGLLAKRLPIQRLLALRLPKTLPTLPEPPESDRVTWRSVLGQHPFLWYLRRRNIHIKAEIAGTRIAVSPGEQPQPVPPTEPVTPIPGRPVPPPAGGARLIAPGLTPVGGERPVVIPRPLEPVAPVLRPRETDIRATGEDTPAAARPKKKRKTRTTRGTQRKPRTRKRPSQGET